jgi:hypothetical protein
MLPNLSRADKATILRINQEGSRQHTELALLTAPFVTPNSSLPPFLAVALEHLNTVFHDGLNFFAVSIDANMPLTSEHARV